MLPGTATLPASRIPIQSAGSALAGAAFRHESVDVLECSSSRPGTTRNPACSAVCLPTSPHTGPRSARPSRQTEGPAQKSSARIARVLHRRFVQHPPDRAAADLLTQRRSASPHQVGKRLATERFFRLRHHLTSHRLDQRLIQRGEKAAFSAAARMIFDGEIAGDPTTSPTLYLSSGQTDRRCRLVVSQGRSFMKKQHKPEALDGLDRYSSAAHLVSMASCRKSSGKVQRAGLGPGMAASFPCRAFWGIHLPLPKLCRIRDVICETDH